MGNCWARSTSTSCRGVEPEARKQLDEIRTVVGAYWSLSINSRNLSEGASITDQDKGIKGADNPLPWQRPN
jgi:hypothetical protein